MKFILSLVTVLCLQSIVFGQNNKGKAEAGEPVICKVNGQIVALIDTKVKISNLSDGGVQLFCNDKGVEILKHKITYSSKALNKMGELIGEDYPLDLSDYTRVGDDKDKDLHAGAILLIELTYIETRSTGDFEKTNTWMIELE